MRLGGKLSSDLLIYETELFTWEPLLRGPLQSSMAATSAKSTQADHVMQQWDEFLECLPASRHVRLASRCIINVT